MPDKTPEQIAAEEAAAEEARKAAEEAERQAAAEAEKNKKKIKFDAEQTLFVNSLYNRAFAEGISKAEKEAQEKVQKQLDDQKAQYEATIAELKKKAEKPTEDPKPNPELDSMKAQLSELRGILDGMKTERDQLKEQVTKGKEERKKARKKDQFLTAMKDAKVDFYDPLEAYELAEKEGLDYDDEAERVIIKNPATGTARVNVETGEPMSALDFMKDFATRKKYLVKSPTQDGGTGSGSERKHEKASEKDYSKMTPEEFEAERQRVYAKPR